MGGGDVVEDEFIGACIGVGLAEGDGIVDVPEVLELSALHDAAVVDVEAGNDSFCQHSITPSVSGCLPW